MTDSIFASTNAFFAGSPNNNNDDDREQTSFEPQGSGLLSRATGGHHLNLRDALEWLLGSAPNPEDEELSHEEKAARSNRRMDLLMWLLNLEPRLAPYGE
ncbi:MAG TPA: hypothetical protein V6C81_19835 [Planktothrix sp.]